MAKKVFDFLDYREFLNQYLRDMMATNRHLTLGSVAKQLKLGDTSSINKVLRGQRHPGPEMIRSLCEWLRLSEKEQQYFMDLVELAKTPDHSPKRIYIFERIKARHPKRVFRDLSFDEFRVISRWHYFAIRELVKCPDFKEEATWIRNKFILPITQIEINDAISTLLSLKLLTRNTQGKLRQSESNFHTPHNIASEAIKRFHEEALENAKKFVRKVPVTYRHSLCSTFGIKVKDIKAFKKKLDELCNQFVEVAEVNTPDAIYQLNIQFSPLTKPNIGAVQC